MGYSSVSFSCLGNCNLPCEIVFWTNLNLESVENFKNLYLAISKNQS